MRFLVLRHCLTNHSGSKKRIFRVFTRSALVGQWPALRDETTSPSEVAAESELPTRVSTTSADLLPARKLTSILLPAAPVPRLTALQVRPSFSCKRIKSILTFRVNSIPPRWEQRLAAAAQATPPDPPEQSKPFLSLGEPENLLMRRVR